MTKPKYHQEFKDNPKKLVIGNERIKLTRPMFRSTFELHVAKYLQKIGCLFVYEPCFIPYDQADRLRRCLDCGSTNIAREGRTLIDFYLPEQDIYIEAKGKWSGSKRKEVLAIQEQYPSIDFRMLFMRNNFLTKNKKQTYGEWCEAHRIKYHVSPEGKVPADWIYPEDGI